MSSYLMTFLLPLDGAVFFIIVVVKYVSAVAIGALGPVKSDAVAEALEGAFTPVVMP